MYTPYRPCFRIAHAKLARLIREGDQSIVLALLTESIYLSYGLLLDFIHILLQ